jgi:hypothetical protein
MQQAYKASQLLGVLGRATPSVLTWCFGDQVKTLVLNLLQDDGLTKTLCAWQNEMTLLLLPRRWSNKHRLRMILMGM